MDKYGEVRDDLTPPETDSEQSKKDLSDHLTKRAAEQVVKPKAEAEDDKK